MPVHNEQFNLNIFDHSSVAYCVVELKLDENGRPTDWIYRYCNPAFAEMKGYRLEAVVDHSFLSLFPKADEKWLRAYYQAAYEEKVCTGDLTLEGIDYHVTVVPIGRKGYCSCMIQNVMDVDKAAAEKGADEEQKTTDGTGGDGLRERTKTLPGGYEEERKARERYVLDKLSPEYVSVYRMELNSGKYEILRLSENTNARQIVDDAPCLFDTFDEYVRVYADTFILEEERDEFTDWFSCSNMQRRLRKMDKITYHYRSVSKQGKYCFFEAYAVKGQISDEEFNIFLGFRNVDSILYKEKAIQKKLEETVDALSVRNEIIAAIAKTYQYISRIDIQADSYEEIINKNNVPLSFGKKGAISENSRNVCKNLIAEEYQEAYLEFVDISTLPERMKNEESIVMEYRMKDGNWHTLRFIEKKRDKNGKLTHVLCAIRSISDTKKRERNLLFMAEEAKKDAALKTRFLSNMSHDIKTPMNGIIGMLEMADRYPDDLEMQKKCRSKIMEASKYLVSLVSDILDINKLEAGEYSNQEITFDLTELLNSANTDKQIKAMEKNVDYVVDWDKASMEHIYLAGNPLYVERLLSVISDNAIKFTKPGGSVHVWCTEKFTDGERTVYEFGCSDTGIGMSRQFLEHAFDLFSQENETSRSRYEGTGLGLAIAKKLADRLGGTIQIDSQKGVGTTVVMTIPFKIGSLEKLTDKADYNDISIAGHRVLVAEDNELNMEIARFMLEENGLLVECACDGAEAVEKFEKAAPGYYDMIFMDIMMPKLNGWDAARKIRTMKKKDAADVPIVAMSANSFSDDIINSRIAGMNMHLTKPLDESKLMNALKVCIGNAKKERFV